MVAHSGACQWQIRSGQHENIGQVVELAKFVIQGFITGVTALQVMAIDKYDGLVHR